jgi:hypothetical protein
VPPQSTTSQSLPLVPSTRGGTPGATSVQRCFSCAPATLVKARDSNSMTAGNARTSLRCTHRISDRVRSGEYVLVAAPSGQHEEVCEAALARAHVQDCNIVAARLAQQPCHLPSAVLSQWPLAVRAHMELMPLASAQHPQHVRMNSVTRGLSADDAY